MPPFFPWSILIHDDIRSSGKINSRLENEWRVVKWKGSCFPVQQQYKKSQIPEQGDALTTSCGSRSTSWKSCQCWPSLLQQQPHHHPAHLKIVGTVTHPTLKGNISKLFFIESSPVLFFRIFTLPLSAKKVAHFQRTLSNYFCSYGINIVYMMKERRVVLGWERHVSVIICQTVALSPNCLTKNVIIAAMSIIGMRKTKLTSYLIPHNCSILGTFSRPQKTVQLFVYPTYVMLGNWL